MVESYDNIKISYVKEPITRDQSHISESKIRENYLNENCIYDNTMNHQVKIKDTKKSIYPVADSFDNKEIFKTTINSLSATDTNDPYRTMYYNKKADIVTKYNEDMLRAENMVKKKNPTK
jgi:hypothetical protein